MRVRIIPVTITIAFMFCSTVHAGSEVVLRDIKKLSTVFGIRVGLLNLVSENPDYTQLVPEITPDRDHIANIMAKVPLALPSVDRCTFTPESGSTTQPTIELFTPFTYLAYYGDLETIELLFRRLVNSENRVAPTMRQRDYASEALTKALFNRGKHAELRSLLKTPGLKPDVIRLGLGQYLNCLILSNDLKRFEDLYRAEVISADSTQSQKENGVS